MEDLAHPTPTVDLAPRLNPAEMEDMAFEQQPAPTQHLGEYGCRTVAKQFKKMMSYEAAVLKDQDIEDLHQMRINLRRLRTTLRTFGVVLALPETVQDQAVKPLAKRLGRVRDLDVLLAALRDRYRPTLSKKEQKVLDQAMQRLGQERDRQFQRMKRFLQSDQCADLKRAFETWIKQPQFNYTGALAVAIALPDLLLPVLSQTLLHPGWLAVPDLKYGGQESRELVESTKNRDKLSDWLNHEGTILHDLRKQMKHLRYQADSFAPYYDSHYKAYTREFKAIQDVLGRLQDAWVLGQTLAQCSGKSWAKKLPTLAQQMAQDRWDAWHEWDGIRQKYLTVEGRSQSRAILLQTQIA
ncbi:MAG: CHAD domain-containing protein [Cyanothece sp. SIO2G6]|nr:CHAD domain-containing protein [Cyanothece sp. SIO2G6]